MLTATPAFIITSSPDKKKQWFLTLPLSCPRSACPGTSILAWRLRAGLSLIPVTAPFDFKMGTGQWEHREAVITYKSFMKWCPWYPTGKWHCRQGESPLLWDRTLVSSQWDSVLFQPPHQLLHTFHLLQRKEYRSTGNSLLCPPALLLSPSTAAVCALREAGLQGLKEKASWTVMGPKIRLHKSTITLALLHCLPACGGLAFAICSIVLLTSFSLGRVVVVRKISNRSWPSFVKLSQQ